jgi:MFS family permease
VHLTLIPADRLGDGHGRRKLFLIGLALFAMTGVLCEAAPNAVVLVVGRLLRGVLAPQVIGLLQLMYGRRARGKAFGYYGATTGLSTAVGPLLGGAVLQYDNEIRTGRHVDQLVGRALQIAHSEPGGPVYLMAAREVLEEPLDPTPPLLSGFAPVAPAALAAHVVDPAGGVV